MQFLDTHQHLIYPDRFKYSWTTGISVLEGGFTQEAYAELAKQAGISAAIFMETAPDDAFYQDEVRFVLGLMQQGFSLTKGVIAGCRPETDAGFDAWLDETDTPAVVGYRRALHVVPDEVSTTPTFGRNVEKIGARGKTFDLCVTQAQLPIGRDLARACPGTMFVVNHCGVPAIAGGDFAGWAKGIDELAALPNVACKISGVVAYAGSQSAEPVVAPYVAHCLERFGADRVVWGGDWPVVLLAMGLPDWAAITRNLTASLSEEERKKLFWVNARRIYKVQGI